ncbi:MAG: hypothetical protein A2V70_15315 [Planctomycetes bacterium RBG_13_63_9]|nr:MAG: hypothetical protein A2V70_15315 [Planctomycetes bacterium RBG_13_63_9]
MSITVPSGWEEDPLARRRASLPPGSWTPERQRAWVGRYLPLILSKSSVRGVFWSQLRDGEPHDFPHGGLFDAKGRAKPALGAVAAVRQKYVE